MLVTDAASGYKTYAQNRNLTHIVMKPSTHKLHGIYHLQNVNAYHSRFKRWHNRFNGTATKYLNNYLTWFDLNDHLTAPKAHAASAFFIESAVPVVKTDTHHLV